MRANKLETALSRDRLACLAPPDMVFFIRYGKINILCAVSVSRPFMVLERKGSCEDEFDLLNILSDLVKMY